jgi:beta-galactosidase
VTEANPAHLLDFRRFASAQVIDYNRMQAEIIRQHAPERFVSHNGMAQCHDFDHAALAHDLDVIAWDSYPLGHLRRQAGMTEAELAAFARTGHSDIAAWHHDFYRGLTRDGRFWVMEQQPGPVNWADHNPAPAAGMVRLWTLEALAHGAEVVSYFRWRQIPFGQEQMHAGLLRVDGEPAEAVAEIQALREDLDRLRLHDEPTRKAPVALLADDQSHWLYRIQPQGREFDLAALNLAFYTACRRLGLDLDVVRPGQDLEGYRLILAPSLPIVSKEAFAALEAASAPVIFGPRSGSKTRRMQLPRELPPGPLQAWLPLKVTRVQSLPPGVAESMTWEGAAYPVRIWQETIESALEPVARYGDGGSAVFREGRFHYLGFWPEAAFLRAYLRAAAEAAGFAVQDLPPTLRLRRRGGLTFAFNYGGEAVQAPAPAGTQFVLGEAEIQAHGVAAWRA